MVRDGVSGVFLGEGEGGGSYCLSGVLAYVLEVK